MCLKIAVFDTLTTTDKTSGIIDFKKKNKQKQENNQIYVSFAFKKIRFHCIYITLGIPRQFSKSLLAHTH